MTTEAARILIVDDQEANREILADQMSLLGHECLLAENGLSALAQIETKKPDLVLLDIMMPVMDGYQVLERLKADRVLRQIPVIVISAPNSRRRKVGRAGRPNWRADAGGFCRMAKQGPVRVLIAHPNEKERDRLSLALKEEHDMEVVGEAEAVIQITQGSSSPKVVIVSAHSDSRFVGLMLYGGATGSCFSRTPSRHSRGYHESHIHRFWSSGRHKVGTATMKGDSARTRRESQE